MILVGLISLIFQFRQEMLDFLFLSGMIKALPQPPQILEYMNISKIFATQKVLQNLKFHQKVKIKQGF